MLGDGRSSRWRFCCGEIYLGSYAREAERRVGVRNGELQLKLEMMIQDLEIELVSCHSLLLKWEEIAEFIVGASKYPQISRTSCPS